MKLSTLSVSAAFVATAGAQSNDVVTWTTTTFISEAYSSSIEVRYGSSPVRPVPTSTAPIFTTRSYISEPVASKNINRTTWVIDTQTRPVEERWEVVYVTGTAPPPTVTIEGTQTERVWISPTIATVTFSPTTCASGAEPPKITSTVYTGDYTPFPGQITTPKSVWPTAVTRHYFQTVSYRVFTFTGSTTTYTSTAIGYAYLSTTVLGTKTSDYRAQGRYWTQTRYRNTVTVTEREGLIAYTTKPVEAACDPGKPATVTRAAQCAPTNLIRERDGRGIEVRVPTALWAFPIGFPNKLLGIPGMDASECCQLCLDNGCAVSRWEETWSRGCSLYFFKSPGLNDTCGTVPLEYFADVWSLPEQAGHVQAGCGKLEYLGIRDQFCPDCRFEDNN